MLKIKKTKPYQFRKLHNNSVTYNNSSNKSKLYTSRVLCSLALICGIVPSLTLLTYYNPYTESTYAARKTLSNITTMQEMTTDICNNSALGQSNTLTDIRDNSTYTVARLSDGNCWMTQNLRLTKESLEANGQSATLSSTTSDVAENSTFAMPTSSESGFSDDTASNAYYGDDINYGAYYTWCTATAGCKDKDGNNPVANVDAASSICPKGWRLPKGGIGVGTNEFANMAGIASNVSNTNYWSNVKDISFTEDTLIVNSSTWLAAGTHLNDSSERIGSYGYYWSNTAYNTTSTYNLYFNNSNFYPASTSKRYRGASVRCLAPASNTDFPELFDEKDSTVSVTVPKVLTIDAISKALTIEADPNQIIEGNISATISANTTYSVQLSAENPDLTNSNDPDHTIPASKNVQKGTNAWGILNQDNSTYSAITTNPTTYYNTEEYNDTEQSTKHTFGIGVSISPALPAGEYSTTVTITAVNN